MTNKTSEIKLIENKSERYYRVTVDGKDCYPNFTYGDDPDNQTEVRRTAKAAAFDEICREVRAGNKITVSYLLY